MKRKIRRLTFSKSRAEASAYRRPATRVASRPASSSTCWYIILDHVAGGPLGGRRQRKQPSRKKERERMEAQPPEEEERNERKWGEEGLSHANDAVRYVCRGAAVWRSNGCSFSRTIGARSRIVSEHKLLLQKESTRTLDIDMRLSKHAPYALTCVSGRSSGCFPGELFAEESRLVGNGGKKRLGKNVRKLTGSAGGSL